MTTDQQKHLHKFHKTKRRLISSRRLVNTLPIIEEKDFERDSAELIEGDDSMMMLMRLREGKGYKGAKRSVCGGSSCSRKWLLTYPTGKKMKNLVAKAIVLLLLSHFLFVAVVCNFNPQSQNDPQIRNLHLQTSPSSSYHHHHHHPQHYKQAKQPSFGDPESSGSNYQRVVVGRPVKFKCIVNDIGEHKVAWFHKDKRLLLAFDNSTVAWKERIQVSSLANSVFFLSIESVQLSDKGQYSCQLNTQPAKSQTHILDVVKSPSIREEGTTHTIDPVKEFSSVELRCSADGIPRPTIKWRRESLMHFLPPTPDSDDDDGVDEEQQDNNQGKEEATTMQTNNQDLDATRAGELNSIDSSRKLSRRSADNLKQPVSSGKQYKSNGPPILAEGEVLRFSRVTRQDMGYYICIASNDVPPSVSQRILLPVSFPHPITTSTSTTKSPNFDVNSTQTAATARKSLGASSSLSIRSGKNLVTTTLSSSGNSNSSAPQTTNGNRKSMRKYSHVAEKNRLQQQAAASASASASSAGLCLVNLKTKNFFLLLTISSTSLIYRIISRQRLTIKI